MNKELIKIISNMDGFVLGIGIDEKLANAIDKNNKILKCDILNYVTNKTGKEEKSSQKLKTLNIRNIKKIYKKKKVDYIICNYQEIEKFLKTFIKDSVYINKTKLYYYGELNKELLIKKYKRYNCKIDIKQYKNSCIIEIDNKDSKINVFKELFYKIIDAFSFLIEIIGDVLMG